MDSNIQAIYDLVDRIKITPENMDDIEKIKNFLDEKQYREALNVLRILQASGSIEYLEPTTETQNDNNDKTTKIEDKREVEEQEVEDYETDETDELEEDGEIEEDDDDKDEETENVETGAKEYDEEYYEEDDEEPEEGIEDKLEEKPEEENEENLDEEDYEEDVEETYEEDEEPKEKNNTDYPDNLAKTKLERKYIGLLLNNVKLISMYYFTQSEQAFVNKNLLEIYKMILFTDGEQYTPESIKRDFNFAKNSVELDRLKYEVRNEYAGQEKQIEKTYMELKKLFTLRRIFNNNPEKHIQDQIAEIQKYKLYDNMSVEEVKDAVEQVTATQKFKRSILNKELTSFLVKGDNTLTNGLHIPFTILSSVFKGIRQGETMAFAMPSNAGKSRFTINLAAYIALIHKKKVLLISNEMSEEKMKLCLITTILNNPDIQKLHGQNLHVTEGQLLEFKFRPNDTKEAKKVKLDENGFILKEEKETQAQFAKRLQKISTEFNMVLQVTDWFNKQINNSIYFINITDHTNEELKKVIMNYYYKEKVEYVFYDTLKTDVDNIGNGEEIKRTATILSNLAQNFNMFIGSTLQLSETSTDPINLNINDLAVSRTVKEVLDTLCLFKQIHKENYKKYEYSLKEVDTKFFNLKKYDDPDERYYSCIVDKNRAGAKPKLLFGLNLAYNRWDELGYLRLKSEE